MRVPRPIHHGHVSIAFCLLSAASIAGAADQLAGSKWLVEDIGRRGVIDNLQTTLEFGADGRVGGRAGCNSWNASWHVTGDKLALGRVATTRRACRPSVADQEQKFLVALAATRSFRIDIFGKLRLAGVDNAVLVSASPL